MKTILLSAALVLSVLFTGCSEKTKSQVAQANEAVSNTVNAPVNYLGTVLKAKQVAEKTIDTVAINNALTLFNEAEGRYPADLNELVTKHYLRVLPQAPYGYKIVYDVAKGEVKVAKQ